MHLSAIFLAYVKKKQYLCTAKVSEILRTDVKKVLWVILLVCCAAISWGQGTSVPTQYDGDSWWNTDYNSTEGTDFYVTFMRNAGKGKFDTDLFLRLFASARKDADVYVYYNNDTTTTYWSSSGQRYFHVDAGTMNGLSNTEAIPNDFAYLEDNTDRYKGIYVHSTSPITLYALNYFQDSYDASIVYPLTALYKEYVIQTYKKDHSASEFVLIGTKQGTHVTIHPRENNIPLNQTIDLYLNEGETYIYRSKNNSIDLSGTYICSSEPIPLTLKDDTHRWQSLSHVCGCRKSVRGTSASADTPG